MIKTIDEMNTYFLMRAKQFGMNFGLERMQELLKGLEVQHEKLKFVHIAGTNGKGSTLQYLKKILSTGGYTVGTFTSPHIEFIEERIAINDRYISEIDFLRLFNKVLLHVESLEQENMFPTEFEMLTVIALMYFQEQKPDIVILETGLGGRLDSTNVINPLLSIITNVSLDHTNILGNTIREIAYEKAGIIKKNSYVVTAVKQKEAIEVIEQKVAEQNSVLYKSNEDFFVKDIESTENGEEFSYSFSDKNYQDLKISMLGKHQTENAALAITAAQILDEKFGFELNDSFLRAGLEEVNWKGRLEVLSKNPLIIVDGSHNEEGIRSLIDTLQARYDDKKIIFVTAALADKDVSSMIGMLEKISNHIICTEFTQERALPANKLAKYVKKSDYSIELNWQEAIEKAMKRMDKETLLVVTGSLYFLYYARPYIIEKLKENQ